MGSALLPARLGDQVPHTLQILTVAGLAAFLIRIRRREAGCRRSLRVGAGSILLWVWPPCRIFTSAFAMCCPPCPSLFWGEASPSRDGAGAAPRAWRSRSPLPGSPPPRCASTLTAFPTSTNGLAAPAEGWKYLADSNIDWGQNLPDLGVYLERNRIERIKTFIFGYDNPFHYLKPGSMDPQTLPAPDNPALVHHYRPQPGLYAVSVNFLTGFLFPQGLRRLSGVLSPAPPNARAGYSILIYEVK